MLNNLIQYAFNHSLITERDKVFMINQLCSLLEISDPTVLDGGIPYQDHIDELLRPLLEYAYQKGLLESLHPDHADLLDSKIMGLFCDRPQLIQNYFDTLYTVSPKSAMDWFYQYNKVVNYIRMHRINKNIQWQASSPYGSMDITINLSKPEKDPKDIIEQRHHKSSTYPLCVLCKENEGFEGHLSHPARQNLRLIAMTLNQKIWYFQYSPYIYYPEHSIILSQDHVPMVINKETFKDLLGFLDLFPYYFIGSNAGLPIVGGSILSHSHYQAGVHEFPLNRASVLQHYLYQGVSVSLLQWPLNAIRLSSSDPHLLVEQAFSVLMYWRGYSCPDLMIFAETKGESHNTLTPIARKKGDYYELDLVLRNNYTTEDRPFGLYHPRKDYHHIKKENIGLIEVMGLAILPGRLENKIILMKDYLLHGIESSELVDHLPWLEEIKVFCPLDDVDTFLKEEIGKVFTKVLEDCGVFKQFDDFHRFVIEWMEHE